MRGLESQSLHVILRSGDPHLEVVIGTSSLANADWSVPTLVQVAGPHRSQANCLIRFSRFENSSLKPVFGRGHVFASSIARFPIVNPAECRRD